MKRSTKIFVRDLLLDAHIGVHEHEQGKTQRIRVSITAWIGVTLMVDDHIDATVSYENLAMAARNVAAGGHINLVETLAERIAAAIITDGCVRLVRVRVEKPDILADAVVGCEILRRGPSATGRGS